MSTTRRATLTQQIAELHRTLTADGVVVNDMRRAQSLELVFAGAIEQSPRPRQAPGIEPLEGPIQARRIPLVSPRESRLRYFLDGTQRTLLTWRCGTVPILATIAASGILHRDDAGQCHLVPGTLRLRHAIIAPRGHADPELQRILTRIEASGMTVVDSFQDSEHLDPESHDLTDYRFLLEASYRAARQVRTEIEYGLLQEWHAGAIDPTGEDWLVADGMLHLAADRAVGLVKSFTNAYLSGGDAATMLSLGPGHRTTAFFPGDRRRTGPQPEARTLWYVRLWDATGLDAMHSLVRLEASNQVRTTTEIDEISSWLWSERTPRATGDARWATLLYPVHFLEKILKQCLDADTQGWPGA